MDDITIQENKVIKRILSLREDIDAIQQPRSNYAIEHFVVGQHVMPGRQRMQAILELQIKLFNIQEAQLDVEKLQIEIEELENKTALDKYTKRLNAIEIQRKKLHIANIELSRKGAIREASALLAITDILPKYTYEEYQAEEMEYWPKRLTNQAEQDLQATGRIGQGNQEALRQAGYIAKGALNA